MKTIKEVCEAIWKLEDKYDLLDFEIDGVKPWQFRRMQIYYLISEKTEVLEQAHTQLSKKDKFFSLFHLFLNSFLYNPFLHAKVESLVFPHERSKRVNGQYIDIYTHYLKEDLNKKNIAYCDMERPYLGKHIRKIDKRKKYLDFIVLLANLGKNFVRVNITSEQDLILNDLQNDIKKIFNIDIDIKTILLQAVQRYKINYYLYTKLLQKLSPKEIYVVISYAHGDLIKAAKDLNISTKELQHGTFSPYHLGYSFPDRKKTLDYFPDQLHVWNNFWKQMIDLPIDDQNVLIYPFQYLEQLKHNYPLHNKHKKQIVVLSQGAIGEKMANIVLNNYKRFADMTIKYKLHPGEYDRWQQYPSLKELSKKPNVEILKDIDLYELFSLSEYQMGVFSTAVYEGVEFGCKTILLNLPGIEYMDKFITYHNLKKDGDLFVSA